MPKFREKDLKKVRDEHFSHATKQGIKPILVFSVRTKAFPGTKRELCPKFFCVFGANWGPVKAFALWPVRPSGGLGCAPFCYKFV